MEHGDLILAALAILAMLLAWMGLLFRKSKSMAWVTLGSLIYMSAYCFKVMNNGEFFGYGYAVLAVLMVLRIKLMDWNSETKHEH